MTVIACDGTTLAGDTQITEDDIKTCRRKVFRKKDCIIGISGCYYSATLFVDWFGSKRPAPDFQDEFDALILYDDGRLYRSSESLVMEPIKEGRDAIGSGQHMAIALMDHGVKAYDAVAYVCTILASCSRPIHRYRRKKS